MRRAAPKEGKRKGRTSKVLLMKGIIELFSRTTQKVRSGFSEHNSRNDLAEVNAADQNLPERFTKVLDQDEALAKICQSRKVNAKANKRLLSHFKSNDYVFTRNDLKAILGKENDELEQLLKKTGYQPLECSTGKDLDQAIESTSFIAEDWLPRGHVTAIVSSPGLGKSYLALAVVKIITTGQAKWFDEGISVKAKSKTVIWCEAEGFQAGLKDRIEQLGIPTESIIFPFKNPLVDFNLDQHLTDLKRVVAYYKPDLVVIDSLRGSHGREENDSKAMQSVMSKLVSLAKEFDVAVLVTHHTNKPPPGQPDLVDLYRVRGSTAITANCRMIWGLDRPDPKDKTVCLKVVKSNLSPFPEYLGLIITDEGIEWVDAPLGFAGFDQESPKKTRVDQAAEWLAGYLKDGPRPAEEVKKRAKEAGYADATLRRASERPGLIRRLPADTDHKFWRWELDAHSPQSNKDEQVNNYEQVEQV